MADANLGAVVATPGALALLSSTGTNPADLLERHASGDWGEVPPEDARENARRRVAAPGLLGDLCSVK